jgi:hypothetical protein
MSNSELAMATHGLPAWPLLGQDCDSLPDAERLVLDAIRAWADPGPAGALGAAALVLASAGHEALALPLDVALRDLSGCVMAPSLSPLLTDEEAALLHSLAAMQACRRSLALGLLHRLAPPLAAYRAMPALITVGGGLKRAGHVLALRL